MAVLTCLSGLNRCWVVVRPTEVQAPSPLSIAAGAFAAPAAGAAYAGALAPETLDVVSAAGARLASVRQAAATPIPIHARIRVLPVMAVRSAPVPVASIRL